MPAPFDFNRNVSYDADAKAAFHRRAVAAMRLLAVALGYAPGTYSVRSNKGGIAVSGEVYLAGNGVLIWAEQSCFGGDNGIVFRTSPEGRAATDGPNKHAPLAMLNDPKGLAALIRGTLRLGRAAA